MPITAITIENFKGIAEPVTIPIRPITLLFGKNSAGKSTILQALHYIREVLEHRRPDPDRTQLGGDTIDLGGFQSLVHRNELDRRIRIRVMFSLNDDGLPYHGIILPGGVKEEWKLYSLSGLSLGLFLESAWVEVVTAWEEDKGAYIAEYATGLNGDEIVRSGQSYGLRPELLNVNFDHAIVKELDQRFPEDVEVIEGNLRERCTRFWSLYEGNDYLDTPNVFSNPVPLNEQDSLIPDPNKPFLVHIVDSVDFLFSDSPVFPPYTLTETIFWQIVGPALTGPLSVLLKELSGIRYLGPIRDVPPRGYRSPKTPMESHWACGLGAWDTLVRDPSLVEKLNHYLQDVLRLGYSVHHERRIAIDAEGEVMAALRLLAAQYEEKDASYLRHMILDPLERLPRHPVIQIHDEVSDIDVEPSDIGVGVSQVIPVVVGALYTGPAASPCWIFAVEQPELHVHPAVQVALGDMFIDAVHNTERTMLIETHSEHLLLRLLRRVRESAEVFEPILTPDMLSIVYVKPKEGGVEITPLPITEEGEFTRHWPDGFFEERAEELF